MRLRADGRSAVTAHQLATCLNEVGAETVEHGEPRVELGVEAGEHTGRPVGTDHVGPACAGDVLKVFDQLLELLIAEYPLWCLPRDSRHLAQSVGLRVAHQFDAKLLGDGLAEGAGVEHAEVHQANQLRGHRGHVDCGLDGLGLQHSGLEQFILEGFETFALPQVVDVLGKLDGLVGGESFQGFVLGHTVLDR